jgi:hypothetical protein
MVPILSPAPLGLEPRANIFHEVSLRFFPEIDPRDSEPIYLARRTAHGSPILARSARKRGWLHSSANQVGPHVEMTNGTESSRRS